MSHIHIYKPATTVRQIQTKCPFCLEATDVVAWEYEYHEPRHTCLSCGYSTWDCKGMRDMTMAQVKGNIKHAMDALATNQ